MTFSLLLQICALFVGLFVLGTLACLPAYHWRPKLFFASKLWVKVYWWTPIFAVFCALLYARAFGAWIVVILLAIQAVREIVQRQAAGRWYAWAYFTIFVICLAHLPFIFLSFSHTESTSALIRICFASVLSDVFAFFAGTYVGRHHLPAFINKRKSYEGVAGQITGAIAGLSLVALLPGITFQWSVAIGIGIASAVGDITNSMVKRAHGMADWGDTIPGHGGVLDRFSSLSFAIAAGYWILQLHP